MLYHTILSGLLVLGITLAANPPEDDDEFVLYTGQTFDEFDWRLCREVNAHERGNVVISPIGVKLLLTMLYEVSQRSTANEIHNTLQLPEKKREIRQEFLEILGSLQEKKNGYVLNMGTKVFIDNSLKPRPYTVKLYQSYYEAAVEQINFGNTSEAARQINSWVESVTHGYIQKVLKNENSLADTMVLFLNALYFRGIWRYPFKPDDKEGLFYVAPTKTVSVNYMQRTAAFYYTESVELDASILRLPYDGNKYSMFIVLPNKIENFPTMLQTVNPTLIRRQFSLMKKQEVHVILPKFKYDYTIYLKDIVQKMGIKEAFTNAANLQKLTFDTGKQLSVSDILQKVGLDVNENGTTAHSTTEMDIINKFGGDSVLFNVSHSFLMFIEEEKTSTVLFVGKVVDPSSTVPVTAGEDNIQFLHSHHKNCKF